MHLIAPRGIIRICVTLGCSAMLVLSGPAALAQPGQEQGKGQGPPPAAQPDQARKNQGEAEKEKVPRQAKEAPGQAKKNEAEGEEQGPAQAEKDQVPGQTEGAEPPGQAKKGSATPPGNPPSPQGGGAHAPGHAKTQQSAEPAGAQQGATAATGTGSGQSTARPRQSGKPEQPRGNAGSIKVNPVGWAAGEDNPPRHHPHVGCEFEVNFYGFYGSIEDVTFAAHPPSGRFVELPVRAQTLWQYDVGPPPGNTLVRTERWDLTEALASDPDVVEHHQQGYHVRVTAESDRQGPGDRKQKVFWVRCDAAQSGIAVGPTATIEAPAPPDSAAAARPPAPEQEAAAVTTPAHAEQARPAAVTVLAEQLVPAVRAPAPPTTVVAASSVTAAVGEPSPPVGLVATGTSVLVQLLAGLLLMAGGAGLRRRAGRGRG